AVLPSVPAGHGQPIGNCRQRSSSTTAVALVSTHVIRSSMLVSVAPGHVSVSGQFSHQVIGLFGPLVAGRRPGRVGIAAMYDGLLVVDADSHKMENPVVFFDYLEAPFRERLFSRTDRWGQQ